MIGHMTKKRGYTYDFTPATTRDEKRTQYSLDQIPAGLWRSVRAKAKREGVSVRALILQLLTDWLADEKKR